MEIILIDGVNVLFGAQFFELIDFVLFLADSASGLTHALVMRCFCHFGFILYKINKIRDI